MTVRELRKYAIIGLLVHDGSQIEFTKIYDFFLVWSDLLDKNLEDLDIKTVIK